MDIIDRINEALNEGEGLSTDEFVKTILKLKNANKNKWYQWTGTVNGKQIQLKAYKTWAQILRVNGLNDPSNMDIKVKEFKTHLEKAVS